MGASIVVALLCAMGSAERRGWSIVGPRNTALGSSTRCCEKRLWREDRA